MIEVKFKPFGQSYLVFAPKAQEKTKGGIIKSKAMLDEEAAQAPDYLIVAAVSDDIKDIAVGDKVFVSSEKLPKIKIDDVEYLIAYRHSTVGKYLD